MIKIINILYSENIPPSMKNIAIIFMLFFLNVTCLRGQNLVNNPSFELVNEVDARWSGTASKFNRKIKQWNSPTQGSPDLFYTKFLRKMYPPRAKIRLKNYSPRTGKFMVGIKTYGCQTRTLHCKEYIQNGLKQPLEPGKQYYYEYWVCPISTSVKVNSFGIGLSTSRVKQFSIFSYMELNSVYTNEELIEGDSAKWFKVSGVFKADSLYKYLIIGNFGKDESIDFKMEEEGLDYGYYLVDDVLLKPKDAPVSQPFKISEPVVLKNILFEFNKAVLQGESHLTLDELADYLKNNPTFCLRIEGHTDSVGSESENVKLSEKRAIAVGAYLQQSGVSPNRISAFGMGSKYPVVSNDSEENRSINRRVEITLEENVRCD